jgi:membrane-bound lytic murein transglycosylase F
MTSAQPSSRRRLLSLALSTALLLGPVLACAPTEEPVEEPARAVGEPIDRDLAAIQERGRLVMLTETNSTSYFVYRGALMGFEFGMLWAFARDIGVELDVKLVESPAEAYEKLNAGVGDVIASQLTPTAEMLEHVAVTVPLYESPPVLVQRKPGSAVEETGDPVREALDDESTMAEPQPLEVRARLISEPSDLEGETVWVPGDTATFDRLVEIRDELTGEIEIIEIESGYEDLMRDVATGQIALTASPRNLADLKQAVYSNLVIRPNLGPPIETVWAVRENATELHRALDAWLQTEKGGSRYNQLYQKYFVDRNALVERERSGFLTDRTSRLSEWDALIERHAREIDWDWRLLASQMYQESKFSPRARSWAGAMGLLQLMPATAREFGVSSPYDPEQNVAGAVRYLAWLENYWTEKIPDDDERLKFILGSYNAGQGHVSDAMRLARKYGDDPTSWDDVAYWLVQKSKRRIYQDPVVYYGYCRGTEPVAYVAYILERFRHYQQLVPAEVPVA